MFVWPKMRYVWAKIGLTGQFDWHQPGNYLKPWYDSDAPGQIFLGVTWCCKGWDYLILYNTTFFQFESPGNVEPEGLYLYWTSMIWTLPITLDHSLLQQLRISMSVINIIIIISYLPSKEVYIIILIITSRFRLIGEAASTDEPHLTIYATKATCNYNVFGRLHCLFAQQTFELVHWCRYSLFHRKWCLLWPTGLQSSGLLWQHHSRNKIVTVS